MPGCAKILLLLVLLTSAGSCADASSDAGVPGGAATGTPVAGTPGPEPVHREILGEMDHPPGAPARRLSLVRYTIAPGAALPPHVHPGVQMASIVSGTLTYRVISGSATVNRAVDATGAARATEILTGPIETTLLPGDVVMEDSAMVHFGTNRTTGPVVILAALLTEGSTLAVLVPDSAAP